MQLEIAEKLGRSAFAVDLSRPLNSLYFSKSDKARRETTAQPFLQCRQISAAAETRAGLDRHLPQHAGAIGRYDRRDS